MTDDVRADADDFLVFQSADAFQPISCVVEGFNIPTGLYQRPATRAICRMADATLIIQRGFPRMLQAHLVTNGMFIIAPLEAAAAFSFNGAICDERTLVVLRGTQTYHCFEDCANMVGVIALNVSETTAAWPPSGAGAAFMRLGDVAAEHLRQSIFDARREAFRSPDDSGDRLLGALAKAIEGGERVEAETERLRSRYIAIVERVDAMLAADPTRRVSNGDMARELGFSARTLHEAVTRIRGRGVQSYVRLRRLWSVRKRLMATADQARVHAIARAYGFRHMGEFSAAYRAAFGEPPSITVARLRSLDER